MCLKLNQSNVTLNDQFKPMLNNLQANILKFHGRCFAHHLFIQVIPEKREDAKKWLASFAETKITTAYKQLNDAALKEEKAKQNQQYDGGTVYTLSISNYGFETLHIKPGVTPNAAFEAGMRNRNELLDTPENWELEFYQKQMDVLIIVANDNAAEAAAAAQEVISSLTPFAICVLNQRGNVLKMEGTGVGIEHFGYADGISQPMYLKKEIESQPAERIWDDETELKMVLVEETGNNCCFGSYLVFRKLEQNVKGFKIAEGDIDTDPDLPQYKKLLPEVLDNKGKPNDELAGAMIVGRFENSTPVTLQSKALHPNPHSSTVTNNFDYSDDLDALKCPFHAHIRLVNPRRGNKQQNPDEIRSHRITRRAIPYDDHTRPYDEHLKPDERKRFPDELIDKIPAELLEDNNLPQGKVGLLFMCYQSDIEKSFEELQGQWANTGKIDPIPPPPNESVGQDSLITQNIQDDNSKRTIPKQWNESEQGEKFNFSGFVKMRGGEYFYTPSLPFLKNITTEAAIV